MLKKIVARVNYIYYILAEKHPIFQALNKFLSVAELMV